MKMTPEAVSVRAVLTDGDASSKGKRYWKPAMSYVADSHHVKMVEKPSRAWFCKRAKLKGSRITSQCKWVMHHPFRYV